MYNSYIHHRRSIRLKGYDYSQEGLYFITVCCHDRICRFGYIKNGEMVLNEYGKIAYNEWIKLSERFSNIELDIFQIMPNHIHGIIPVGTGFIPVQINNIIPVQINNIIPVQINNIIPVQINNVTPAQNNITPKNNNSQPLNNNGYPCLNNGQPQSIAPTIGDIVGAYKSLVTNGCLNIYKSKNETMGKLWQRNYYEHIIRDEKSHQNISNYIINNPVKWNDDTFNSKRNIEKK